MTAVPELTFHETMSGFFALGVSDPDRGSDAGKDARTRMTLRAAITIVDMDRFVADPAHVGQMEAEVEFRPLGGTLLATRAIFNLFSPSDRPGVKLMVYELALAHGRRDLYFVGHKDVHHDQGIDLWSDTTTLRVRLHEGSDANGEVVGAGVLTIGVPDLLRLVQSIRVRNTRSPAESAAVVAAFGRFFLGALWETYAPVLPGR